MSTWHLTEQELDMLRVAVKRMNPHPNPAYVFYTDADERIEGARAYFTWELLNGADPEKLKRNSCWHYYESDEEK